MSRRVAVLNAGLSNPSSTRLLADQIGAAVSTRVTARGESLELDVIDIRSLAADLATSTVSGMSTPAVVDARERVAAADAVVAVTPVFSASYSGLFKMFVDLLDPDALTGVPVLVAATAGTPRHALVVEHALRPLFSYLRAVVVPTGVFAATEDFGTSGLSDRIARAADELAALLTASASSVAGFTAGLEPVRRPRRASGLEVGAVTPFEQLLQGHTGEG